MLTKKLTFVFIFLVSTSFLSASEMESVLEVGRENSSQSAVSQEKIDSTEKQTDKIVNEYKVVAKQVEGLKLYNEQKRIQIQAQLDLMDKLDEQLVQVVVMQRQIPPLAQRMLEGLEQFVALDTPFYIDERMERLDIVRSSLSNPKITASEQVRQILEAYNIEAEYGRKISSYEDTIVIDGKEMVVNVLVVGRIGMFYQTKDEQQSGVWNNETMIGKRFLAIELLSEMALGWPRNLLQQICSCYQSLKGVHNEIFKIIYFCSLDLDQLHISGSRRSY